MLDKDIKPGMRVIYRKGTVEEDTGTVLGYKSECYNKWLIEWDSDGSELQSDAAALEPLESHEAKSQQAPKAGTLTLNPGKTVKIQKMVEVEEVQEDTYTFTVSRKAAQELRAIIGVMHNSELSSLSSELCENLENTLWDTPDCLWLVGTCTSINAEDFKLRHVYY